MGSQIQAEDNANGLRDLKITFCEDVTNVQDKGRLLVAGVGDSRCILGRMLPNGAVRAVALSIDHTPEHPGEAARVRLNGVRPSHSVLNAAFIYCCAFATSNLQHKQDPCLFVLYAWKLLKQTAPQ